MYENKTFDYLINEMLDNVEADIDKSEGSLMYDALAPVAMELEETYIEMDEILKRGFAQTSYEEYLDMKCAEFGVTRKQGTKANGQVTFSGADNTVIPINTLIQTESGLQYLTTSQTTILNGTAVVNIESNDIGVIYNVPANTIIEIPISITGIASLTNSAAITGGTEVETDADLLTRLLLKVQTPATSGNANDYKLWAMSVDGIGDVKIFPLWNGAGTVKVCVIDSNKQPANSTLVTAVQTYTEANRPIGANVTYEAAAPLALNISVNITRDTNYTSEQVVTDINKNITAYLYQIAFKQNYVSYGRIGSAILDSTGVIDYTDLTINSGTSNISVEDEKVAILGSVTVNG